MPRDSLHMAHFDHMLQAVNRLKKLVSRISSCINQTQKGRVSLPCSNTERLESFDFSCFRTLNEGPGRKLTQLLTRWAFSSHRLKSRRPYKCLFIGAGGRNRTHMGASREPRLFNSRLPLLLTGNKSPLV